MHTLNCISTFGNICSTLFLFLNNCDLVSLLFFVPLNYFLWFIILYVHWHLQQRIYFKLWFESRYNSLSASPDIIWALKYHILKLRKFLKNIMFSYFKRSTNVRIQQYLSIYNTLIGIFYYLYVLHSAYMHMRNIPDVFAQCLLYVKYYSKEFPLNVVIVIENFSECHEWIRIIFPKNKEGTTHLT